ncbi:MAG: hypothetical protein ACJ77Z_21145 [Thermoleophilaceae bacterium]
MLECPRCGIRQYAATSYVGHTHCVACEARLAAPKSLEVPRSLPAAAPGPDTVAQRSA